MAQVGSVCVSRYGWCGDTQPQNAATLLASAEQNGVTNGPPGHWCPSDTIVIGTDNNNQHYSCISDLKPEFCNFWGAGPPTVDSSVPVTIDSNHGGATANLDYSAVHCTYPEGTFHDPQTWQKYHDQFVASSTKDFQDEGSRQNVITYNNGMRDACTHVAASENCYPDASSGCSPLKYQSDPNNDNAVCKQWYRSLPTDADAPIPQSSIVDDICGTATGAEVINECQCLKRDALDDFKNIANQEPFRSSPVGCWWGPCKNTDEYWPDPQVDSNPNNCPDICMQVLNIQAGNDSTVINKISQTLNCPKNDQCLPGASNGTDSSGNCICTGDFYGGRFCNEPCNGNGSLNFANCAPPTDTSGWASGTFLRPCECSCVKGFHGVYCQTAPPPSPPPPSPPPSGSSPPPPPTGSSPAPSCTTQWTRAITEQDKKLDLGGAVDGLGKKWADYYNEHQKCSTDNVSGTVAGGPPMPSGKAWCYTGQFPPKSYDPNNPAPWGYCGGAPPPSTPTDSPPGPSSPASGTRSITKPHASNQRTTIIIVGVVGALLVMGGILLILAGHRKKHTKSHKTTYLTSSENDDYDDYQDDFDT